jgi:hypothetical protein
MSYCIEIEEYLEPKRYLHHMSAKDKFWFTNNYADRKIFARKITAEKYTEYLKIQTQYIPHIKKEKRHATRSI